MRTTVGPCPFCGLVLTSSSRLDWAGLWGIPNETVEPLTQLLAQARTVFLLQICITVKR
jgi:hypothetical protein